MPAEPCDVATCGDNYSTWNLLLPALAERQRQSLSVANFYQLSDAKLRFCTIRRHLGFEWLATQENVVYPRSAPWQGKEPCASVALPNSARLVCGPDWIFTIVPLFRRQKWHGATHSHLL